VRARAERRGILAGAAAVALLAGALALRAITGAGDFALPTALGDLLTLALGVFIESLPFVFLGVGFSTVVRIWLPQRLLDRVLPRRPLPRRMVLSLAGILMPVCECGNVPVARGLLLRGFTAPEAVTFLLAAPILNPVTIITTYQAFGWSDGVLIGRIVGGFSIANVAGLLLSGSRRPLVAAGFAEQCAHEHPERGSRLRRSLEAFTEETGALLPALILGSALAGAIQVGVPREALIALGAHPVWSVLALIALAFVISICSSVDAFFILSLSAAFLPGGVVAFLLFGAMLDVKMLALLRTTFTGRALAFLTGFVALSCVAIGLAVNLAA